MPTPLIVIGLDGATFDIIQPLVERGELPAFSRLMSGGAWGRLQSVTPPVSPQAWASFLTGALPDQHGVFGFQGAPQGSFYQRPILNAADIHAPTLLQIAGEAGLRVASLGMPMTYPPSPVNGVIVPEQYGPPLSYPPALWAQLTAAAGDLRDNSSHIPYIFTEDKRGFVARQMELAERQRQAAEWLWRQEPFDLFCLVFTHSDRMAHFLWKSMDAAHPAHTPRLAELMGDALPALYRMLDRVIAEWLERLSGHGTLLVMSDHGFGPQTHDLFINHWLREQGWLAVRPLPYRLASLPLPWPFLRLVNALARRLGLPNLAIPFDRFAKPFSEQLYDPRGLYNAHLFVDWRRTRAYSSAAAEQGIFINVKGRQPLGIVAPGEEYDLLREKICRSLAALRDPDDGGPVFAHVWRREEVHRGEKAAHAPDILLQLRDGYAITPVLFTDRVVAASRHYSGNHRLQGVCLLYGEGVRPGAALEQAQIIDLAPTLLHLAGLPVPASMQGRVLSEAFTPGWNESHPVRRVDYAGADAASAAATLTPEETARLEAHLRSLGYLS